MRSVFTALESVTVSSMEAEFIPSVAVMIVVPALSSVTVPLLSTVATVSSLLLQVTVSVKFCADSVSSAFFALSTLQVLTGLPSITIAGTSATVVRVMVAGDSTMLVSGLYPLSLL